MNKQEIFTKVRKHLLAQGRTACRSVGRKTFCAYYAENGDRCAIGCLIPDEMYVPEMDEGSGWPVCRVLEKVGILRETGDEDFARDLQRIHDKMLPNRWPAALWEFGEWWGLCLEDAP